MDHSDLGARMKKYEYVTRNYLVSRMPVIIRIDGKAFHTFTRGFERPFDSVLVASVQQTMKYLCENIQGCVLGYTQSDEISLVLVDYKKIDSASWFDNNIQKCASISASMATLVFNRFFRAERGSWMISALNDKGELSESQRKRLEALSDALNRGAMFDSRVFNLPREEVCNYLLWRQIDAARNSVQMVGQSVFSHRELQKKSCAQIQEMLFQQHGINWNDYPVHLKRGSCCIRVASGEHPERKKWEIDLNIPEFKGEDRVYVDSLIGGFE